MANVPNTEKGEIKDVNVNEKQVLLTLYFEINANTITESFTDIGYSTALTFDNIRVVNFRDEVDLENPTIIFANDYATMATNAEAITVEKLGDVNVVKDPVTGAAMLSDGMVRIDDVKAIQKKILAGEYDARADIDQDGMLTIRDMLAIQRYIIFAHTYAEMVSR
jgi:hypothetical protein